MLANLCVFKRSASMWTNALHQAGSAVREPKSNKIFTEYPHWIRDISKIVGEADGVPKLPKVSSPQGAGARPRVLR